MRANNVPVHRDTSVPGDRAQLAPSDNVVYGLVTLGRSNSEQACGTDPTCADSPGYLLGAAAANSTMGRPCI